MTEPSRNSWIKKDDPKLLSTKHKDIYEDLLSDRRSGSDLRWALRSRDVPAYKFNHPRNPCDLREHVLNSDRVKYAVDQVCLETGAKRDEVMKQTESIADEMSHNLRLGAIRGFACFLIKVMKKLFRHIYVNESSIQKVRALIREYPVLLLPSHRSYMDFLLVSTVFYNYDLPLPVIAAAMDFMDMKFVGWLLRSSGAFYIRRNFGDDQLYWAVFTEYVQTQISNADMPIEFYVEGTRSRTQKSYPPKFGMLSASLEPYFKAHIPDIMVLPISISYSRVLEESLYAYELLGVPKPKESTSALFKARGILSDNYGDIHFHVGDPISIRKHTDGNVDRSIHSLRPRYIASLTADESKLIYNFGHHVVLCQQKNMVICPWSLVASVLMQNKDGLSVKQLIKEVEWLKRQASNLGAYIDWPGSESADSVIRASIELHKNIAMVTSDDIVELCVVDQSKSLHQEHVFTTAAQQLMLSIYRNQLLHVFVRVALIALSINACSQEELPLDELFMKYGFLEQLLSRDFIFLYGKRKQDFEQSLLVLTHTCGVVIKDEHVVIKKSTNKYTTFFSQMFEPFLLGYWILCQYLLSMHSSVHGRMFAKPPKSIAREAQLLSASLVRDGIVGHPEILSLDLMNNGLQSLVALGAVKKDKRDGSTYMTPNIRALSRISNEIGKFLDVQTLPLGKIHLEGKRVAIEAKL